MFLVVVTPPSIYHGCSTQKTLWEEKFIGKEYFFLSVNMKHCRILSSRYTDLSGFVGDNDRWQSIALLLLYTRSCNYIHDRIGQNLQAMESNKVSLWDTMEWSIPLYLEGFKSLGPESDFWLSWTRAKSKYRLISPRALLASYVSFCTNRSNII